jgi:hypothetical protein
VIHQNALAVIGDWGPRWALVCGRWQDVLPTLPAGSIHHAIFDPPYSEHVHSKSRAGARKVPLRDGKGRMSRCAIMREATFGFDCITIDEMDGMADQCERLTTRWSMAFCDVESVHLWVGAFKSSGLNYRRTCSWEKIGCTPQFSGDRPGVGFECIVTAHQPGRSVWNGGGKQGVYHHIICIDRGGDRRANNERVHPTQKPLDLMLELVADFTSPDDIVLDMTSGSSTTGVACLRLGRRYIGIESNIKWAMLGREKLEAEGARTTVKANRAGQTSIFERCGT